jgi:hypothetical protein
METVSIRLPAGMLEEIDRCTRRLKDDTPLLDVTRTDAIRFLIQVGLREVAKRGVRLK